MLIDDLELLAYRLFVDVLEYLLGKLVAHAEEGALHTALVEYLVVTSGLEDLYVVFLLILTYLTTYAHTLGEEFHEVVVDLVDLLSE